MHWVVTFQMTISFINLIDFTFINSQNDQKNRKVLKRNDLRLEELIDF